MKEILLIITGSVASFKALELIRMLVKQGLNVKTVLSKGGENFITPLSISSLSGNEVLLEDTYKMEHISLTKNSDIILICPASASFINKMAYGIGGDLTLDLMLAKTNIPVILAPAMNVKMWHNVNTVEAIERLKKQNVIIIEPLNGELLCKEEGEGKLADLNEIFAKTVQTLENNKILQGKKFLITNGATVERIDDARFISNFSSGLQGSLIAQEILNLGGEVFLIEGKTCYKTILPIKNLHKIKVESAKEMLDVSLKILENNNFDAFFSVAAVSDFCVKNRVKGKVKKEDMFKIELEQNPDILKIIANHKNRPKKIFGFAAEEEQKLKQNGSKKLEAKNCDVLFANEMCFEANETKGLIITKLEITEFSGTKYQLSKVLLAKL